MVVRTAAPPDSRRRALYPASRESYSSGATHRGSASLRVRRAQSFPKEGIFPEISRWPRGDEGGPQGLSSSPIDWSRNFCYWTQRLGEVTGASRDFRAVRPDHQSLSLSRPAIQTPPVGI